MTSYIGYDAIIIEDNLVINKVIDYKNSKLSDTAQSFTQGFKDALSGNTFPIETLWGNL